MHPLNQILKFHCRELIIPNTFGTPALVNEARFMDLLFAYGNDGAIRLLRDAHPFSTWDITDFRRNIKVQHVKYYFKIRASSSRGVVTTSARLELSGSSRGRGQDTLLVLSNKVYKWLLVSLILCGNPAIDYYFI